MSISLAIVTFKFVNVMTAYSDRADVLCSPSVDG